ncbi:winged helix-turn-helix domain-containing protein [Nocardioides guangzhouensis]|uniref:Winged helix-turn-helix domain-containing protein n=1 Tax=Nocardioides guangzhouensis TaxID=2497878 RepID=A0A4Q4Z1U5_9ACTN|nr:crosslink repair DNA glycosylase YcaQ family protein [Nocardioides guangzhouensis]RYP81268.1 winged helix-turn-helix domain-containing protein [Nocardioides guangzhouensis]
MATPHELTRDQARRIAVRAQLLDGDRPTDLLGMLRHVTSLQNDPTAAVAPSAELVAWSRLGSSYRLGDLAAAEAAGQVVELGGMLRPAEDIALYTAEMAAWPGPGRLRDWEESQRDWVEANDGCRRDILDKLYDEGPLPATELPDTTVLPWESSGWNNDRSRRMLIGLMVRRGEVASAGYDGRTQLWDLAERVYPDVPPVPYDEALRIRDERRLRALGIARAKAPELPGDRVDVGDAGEPAVVEGVRGTWRVDPEQVARLDVPFTARAALLSPLDRLVYDRKRMTELLGFDYQLEMYKPAAKRRWGYWAMPILHGDRLVGKLDARAERADGVLRVHAVHEDEPFPDDVRTAVDAEVDALARWLGLAVDPDVGGAA